MAMKSPTINKKPGNLLRLSLFWAIIIFIVLLGASFLTPHDNLKDVPISTIISDANSGKISKLEIQGQDVKATVKGNTTPTEKSVIQSGSSIQDQGLKADAPVELTILQPSTTGDTLWNLAIIIVPVILIAGFFTYMMRQAQGQSQHLGRTGPCGASCWQWRWWGAWSGPPSPSLTASPRARRRGWSGSATRSRPAG